jgi:hypothetical protein
MSFTDFIKERQYLMNVSDHTMRWYRCALKWTPCGNRLQVIWMEIRDARLPSKNASRTRDAK